MKRIRKINFATTVVRAFFLGALFLSELHHTHAQESSATAKTTKATPDSPSGFLEFLDGSTLRGQLQSIDSSAGLKWEHPSAKQPIEFKPENIASIRFPNAIETTQANSEATCQFRFTNGDEFYGNLLALDETELEMRTGFGGTFKTPRATVQSIRFFPKGAALLYEGPTSLDGWVVGKRPGLAPWRYEDGALVADATGTIGREFNLPDAARIEFDLEWGAPFNLLFSFYTGVFDAFNYNNGSYMFYISPGNVYLQRINSGSGPTAMGRNESILPMLSKKKVRLEFRGNKEESVLELLVDGKLVNQWKDAAGWGGKGSGILFFAQNESAIKISNIKVAPWDGKPGSESAINAPGGIDQLYLANRDKVSGKIGSLREGNLQFKTDAAALNIPLSRITQIVFSSPDTNAIPRAPWEIQASVSGGGKISFTLENWNREKVFGQNKNFGKISLNSKSIRQLQFNLGQTRVAVGEVNPADGIIWEDNEP